MKDRINWVIDNLGVILLVPAFLALVLVLVFA